MSTDDMLTAGPGISELHSTTFPFRQKRSAAFRDENRASAYTNSDILIQSLLHTFDFMTADFPFYTKKGIPLDGDNTLIQHCHQWSQNAKYHDLLCVPRILPWEEVADSTEAPPLYWPKNLFSNSLFLYKTRIVHCAHLWYLLIHCLPPHFSNFWIRHWREGTWRIKASFHSIKTVLVAWANIGTSRWDGMGWPAIVGGKRSVTG